MERDLTEATVPAEKVSNDVFAFETGQSTDKGCRRKINEDAVLCMPDRGIWVLADGMGGHAAGDFASGAIVEAVGSMGVGTSVTQDLERRFMDRLRVANERIVSHASDLGRGAVGSTVAGLLISADTFACIWAGDSRIYLLRDGRLTQVTTDHTEVQAMIDAGSLTPEQAETWPRRNVITRAIGVGSAPDCDVVDARLHEGDVFLLCSDGLTAHCSDEDIRAALVAPAMSAQQACDSLVSTTLERGAKDNVTVAVVRVSSAPASFDLDSAPMPDLRAG